MSDAILGRFAFAAITVLMLSIGTAGQQAAKPSFPPMDEWRRSRVELLMNDFGELSRYREANAQLQPATVEPRIVFFGDSIIDIWPLEKYFPGKPYINRGIGGQTTSQMLVRFRQDVVSLRPATVVILAGTNDIAGNTGPMSLEDTEANFASMAELAHAHNIRVVFSSILPVHNRTPQSQRLFAQRPPEKIRELNRWLKDYCAANGHVYLDYFSAMEDETGLLKKNLSADGLHPNEAGYAIMAPLAGAAIERATKLP